MPLPLAHCFVATLLAMAAMPAFAGDDGAAGDADAARPAPASALPARLPDSKFLLVNGFGTVAAVHSTLRTADFVFDNLQPNGVGRSRNWSPDVDSRLGLQLTANFTPQLTGVLQVVSEYRWDDTYTPTVTWANLKYAFTPDFSVRVGRIALASFLASDSRRIGYSNIMARPPTEVYRLLALRDSDGVDAAWRTHFAGFTHNFTVLYGRRTVTNTRGIDVHSTAVRGIFDTAQRGALTLHAAYQLRDVDNQNPPLGRFMSLGASYDPGPWFASGEWVKSVFYDARSLRITRAAWYGNAGWRVGNFSPYLALSVLDPLSDTGVAPLAQRTWATGVRWDVTRNADLKLQVEQVRLGGNSYGNLQNILPSTQRGSHFYLLSLMADFLY